MCSFSHRVPSSVLSFHFIFSQYVVSRDLFLPSHHLKSCLLAVTLGMRIQITLQEVWTRLELVKKVSPACLHKHTHTQVIFYISQQVPLKYKSRPS